MRVRTSPNCVVLSAGRWTVVTCTPLFSCISSVRSESEAADRVLGAAVRGLQRDAAVGEGGADLDDRAAVARAHPLQRGHRAVDLAEVGDLGRAAELLGADLPERRQDRRHRDVDPDVDLAELAGHALGGRLDLLGVGDVRGNRERAAARLADLPRGALERVLVAGEQGDRVAAAGERAGGRAPDAAGRSGDDDDHAAPFPASRGGEPPVGPNSVVVAYAAPSFSSQPASQSDGSNTTPRAAPIASTTVSSAVATASRIS